MSLGQISAGTCTNVGNATTASLSVTAGSVYQFNVYVTNLASNTAPYVPSGLLVDSSLLHYYPLQNSLTDVVSWNTLVAATYGTGSGTAGSYINNRYNFASSVMSFTGSNCVVSTSTLSTSVTRQNSRAISFSSKTGSITASAALLYLGETPTAIGHAYGYYWNPASGAGTQYNIRMHNWDPAVLSQAVANSGSDNYVGAVQRWLEDGDSKRVSQRWSRG